MELFPSMVRITLPLTNKQKMDLKVLHLQLTQIVRWRKKIRGKKLNLKYNSD
jgi:hypothetical protein